MKTHSRDRLCVIGLSLGSGQKANAGGWGQLTL